MRPNRYPYSGANTRAVVLETRNYGTGEIMHKELETPLKSVLRILRVNEFLEEHDGRRANFNFHIEHSKNV